MTKPVIQPTQLIAPENRMATAGTPAIRTRKGLGYIAHPTNVELYPDVPQDFVPDTGVLGKDPEDAYDEGYYIGVINTADEMSQPLCLCFNCGRGGHYWADCTEPLKDSLKQAKERVNREIRENQEKQLNPNGGAGGKGARAPPRLYRSVPIQQRVRTEHHPTDSLIILE